MNEEQALAQIRQLHPWRRARKESVFWGRAVAWAIGAAVTLAVFLVAEPLGMNGAAAKLLVAGALYGILGGADLVRVRYLGAIREGERANTRLMQKITELERQVYALTHPDRLNLYIPQQIWADLFRVDDPYTSFVLALRIVTITNRTDLPVSLDIEAELRLAGGTPPDCPFFRVKAVQANRVLPVDRTAFHVGVLKIPAHDTVSVRPALALSPLDVHLMHGIQRVDMEKSHVIHFRDRNSSLAASWGFTLADVVT